MSSSSVSKLLAVVRYIGPPVVCEDWGWYWFSICILPIASHASFQVTNQRTKQATSLILLQSPHFEFLGGVGIKKKKKERKKEAKAKTFWTERRTGWHWIDKYLMASKSRLIWSKAMSAIHPDLGVFLVSSLFVSCFLLFLSSYILSAFFPVTLSFCVSARRWINKRLNGNAGSIGTGNVEMLANAEERGNRQLDERDKCWRDRSWQRLSIKTLAEKFYFRVLVGRRNRLRLIRCIWV